MCRCEPSSVDGTPYLLWIASVFEDCIYTSKDIASFVIGFVSMAIWMLALWPQFFQNIKRGSVESQSMLFWMLQMSGDITNLIGCLLSHQLPTMLGLAIVYCSLSISMFSQYIYYTRIRKIEPTKSPLLVGQPESLLFASPRQPYITRSSNIKSQGRVGEVKREQDPSILRRLSNRTASLPDSNSSSANKYTKVAAVAASVISVSITVFTLTSTDSVNSSASMGTFDVLHTLAVVPPTNNGTEQTVCGVDESDAATQRAGVVIGWVMTSFYLMSRSPQIYLNYTRGDAEGLSMKMFVLTFCGNMTYLLSMVLRAIPPSHVAGDFVTSKLPWIIDAGGCMVQDLIILAQCEYYRRRKIQRGIDYQPLLASDTL